MNASVKMSPDAAMRSVRDRVSQFTSQAGKSVDWAKKYPVMMVAGGVLLLSLLVVMALWAGSRSEGDNWQPLYGRQELYDVAAIIEALDAGQLSYRLHPVSGQIMVEADQVPAARMQLATAGIKPAAHTGMELLTSGSQLGRSQYVERKQYLEGLEGELEQTIASLRPVRTARVHLAVPERTAFLRDQSEPSASVFLDLYPGIDMDGRQVQGVINLLSGSFPDLKPENIHVLDQNSNPLTTDKDTSNEADRQIEYRRRIEQQYVQKLLHLLEPVAGKDNLRVAVNADVDFSYEERSREGFDPDSAVLRSESYSGSTAPQTAKGVPGVTSNVENLNENPLEEETADEESSVSSVRNYEMDRTLSYQREEAFRVVRINASVILNSRIQGVETEAALAAISDLAGDAVGIDISRGDRVTVRALPFFNSVEPEEERLSGVVTVVKEGDPMMLLLIGIVALIIVVVIVGMVYYFIRRKRLRREQEALEAELTMLDSMGDSAGQEDAKKDDIYSNVSVAASERVRDLTVSNPEQIASILEKWIKEAD